MDGSLDLRVFRFARFVELSVERRDRRLRRPTKKLGLTLNVCNHEDRLVRHRDMKTDART
jgi:hypothetical protein